MFDSIQMQRALRICVCLAIFTPSNLTTPDPRIVAAVFGQGRRYYASGWKAQRARSGYRNSSAYRRVHRPDLLVQVNPFCNAECALLPGCKGLPGLVGGVPLRRNHGVSKYEWSKVASVPTWPLRCFKAQAKGRSSAKLVSWHPASSKSEG